MLLFVYIHRNWSDVSKYTRNTFSIPIRGPTTKRTHTRTEIITYSVRLAAV